MKGLWQVFSTSLGLVAVFLCVPFMSRGAWLQAGLTLVLVAGWGLAVWRRSRLFNLVFACLAALIAHAAASPFPAIIPLTAFTLSLVAWDLSEFSVRLREYEIPPAAIRLIRSHLERVLAIAGIGLLLGNLALLLRFRLSFEVTILTGLLIFLGLAQIIRFLRSLSD